MRDGGADVESQQISSQSAQEPNAMCWRNPLMLDLSLCAITPQLVENGRASCPAWNLHVLTCFEIKRSLCALLASLILAWVHLAPSGATQDDFGLLRLDMIHLVSICDI